MIDVNTGESWTEEKQVEAKLPVATNLSVQQQKVMIQGWFAVPETKSLTDIRFVMKKRRTSTAHLLPVEWTNEHWSVTFDVTTYALYRGVWDFYLLDTQTEQEHRLKLQEGITPSVTEEGLYHLDNASLQFELYRTIKDSLSLTIQTARASIGKLQFKPGEEPFALEASAQLEDAYVAGLVTNHTCNLTFINRQTAKHSNVPLQLKQASDQPQLLFVVNYQQLIDFDSLRKTQWDAYIQIHMNEESFYLRIHLQDEVDQQTMQKESLVAFQETYMYQIYFYETIKNHLSIDMHRTPIKQTITHYSIEQDMLSIQGYGYLDIQHLPKGAIMKRQIIVRRRGSDDDIIVDLPEITYDDTQGSFDVDISLQQVVALEEIEKEIFDVSLQVYYAGAWYEKRLGFEDLTYIKDDILGKAFLKNKDHYTRVYLTQTPSGNLKIETYYLTRAAYYYLKFGQKIDRKLQQNKEVWLIGERSNTAQDTGYHFFKYCREHHPDLAIYYVIHAGSKDTKNIEHLGNILYSGTLQHVRKASIASVFIGSHDLDNILPLKGLELHNYVRGKRVFLQHGVLGRKNVEYHKKYYRDPFHLFCVSSIPEKKLVEKQMGYEANEVKVTGLSRFDTLLENHEERRSILLMPTWREWLGREDSFRQSKYYQRYLSLLNNEDLHSLLEKYDVTLDFYPHYRMQPFLDAFQKIKSDRVNIIALGEITVQQLLMANKLMITDYSSVSFDFNYMSKPIIFYHFDEKAFFKNGILRPMSETFLGDICQQEAEVIQSIAYYMEHDFVERQAIQDKKEQIFTHIDRENNERIFAEIQKMKETQGENGE